MSCPRIAPAFFAASLLTGARSSRRPPRSRKRAPYEIQIRMEIPNVNAWSWSTTRRVCLPGEALGGAIPIPVLSPNNPFGGCQAEHVERSIALLSYDIACSGRGAARAHARYTLLASGFTGQIDMVLGAKNMTMRELQVGRHLGSCELATLQE